MGREKPTFRAELEEILRYFGDKRILSVTDMVNYTGMSREWVTAHIGTQKITAVQFAYALTNLNN